MRTSLADRYRAMPEPKLLQIAIHEAGTLAPEAIPVLKAELAARGVAPVVFHAVDAQTQPLSDRDVEVLTAALRDQPCPECGQAGVPLNGGVVASAMSFVVFTTHRSDTVIACPDCLGKEARRAAGKTAVLGWWGLPWGPIQSVRSLAHDLRTLRQRGRDKPSSALRTLVRKSPGVATVMAARAARPAAAPGEA